MTQSAGLRVVVGSHSERFGYRIGRWTRRAAVDRGLEFGAIQKQDEFELANGSTWLSRGVGAAISGLPADLLVVDDPYGTAEDARSEVYRNKVADWYEEDLLARVQSGGSVVLVHTRWGPDDLIGRRLEQDGLKDAGGQWEYLKLPAVAEEGDSLGRAVGEALCPERFTAADLETKRSAMRDPAAWESLYQCNPLPRGGTFIRREWLTVVELADCPWMRADVPQPVDAPGTWRAASLRYDGSSPAGPGSSLTPAQRLGIPAAEWAALTMQAGHLRGGGDGWAAEGVALAERARASAQVAATMVERVRYWDLAGTTTETACYTAGVLLAKSGGRFYVEDVVRGRWVPAERNAVIVQTAKADRSRPGFRKTYFEQEPGSSGIDAAQRLGEQLAGERFEADRVTGDKDTRFEPFADACRLGLVRVVNASWTGAFLTEVAAVPVGRYRDQGDSVGGAFNAITKPEPCVAFNW